MKPNKTKFLEINSDRSAGLFFPIVREICGVFKNDKKNK